MKGFLKIIGVILLIPYIAIAITLTVFLLNYNKYGLTEIGGKTLINVTDDSLSPKYKKGDLLVVKNTEKDKIKTNDFIFFYEQNTEKNTVVINLGRVISTRKVTDTETTFKLEGDVDYSSEYVIGSTTDTKVYDSLGTILSTLESRWVFLIFIIVPILFLFLYEIYEFVLEVKRNLKES